MLGGDVTLLNLTSLEYRIVSLDTAHPFSLAIDCTGLQPFLGPDLVRGSVYAIYVHVSTQIKVNSCKKTKQLLKHMHTLLTNKN